MVTDTLAQLSASGVSIWLDDLSLTLSGILKFPGAPA